jgi:23S rRNA (pseudouridine1915-N3)-methyltransferase
MLKIDIIVVGRLRSGAFFELSQEFMKRITWSLSVYEVEAKQRDPAAAQQEEGRKIAEHLDDRAFVIVMDEHGNGLRSLDFAKTLEKLQNTGERHIQFIIGGADGLTEQIKDRANLLLSFGQQTWPHMLVRVMLLEQVYRAQQILIGHPYHRE